MSRRDAVDDTCPVCAAPQAGVPVCPDHPRYVVRTAAGYFTGYGGGGDGWYAARFGAKANARRVKQRRDADTLAKMFKGKVEVAS